MSGDGGLETNIMVAIRCRPLNSREKSMNEPINVRLTSDQVVLVNPANNEEVSFGFDIVFDSDVTQEAVWLKVGAPILNKAILGYNSTIFAYGQTGSGKTWSMQGGDTEELSGIIPRMGRALFQRIEEEKSKQPTTLFLVTASYFEIYNEVIFDLLDPSDRKKRLANAKGGLEIKEHPALGVYVKGLQELVVDSSAKLESITEQGMRHRTVASTQMNADSSRSHSVFVIQVHQKDTDDPSKNIFAKINLVDLAGSERVKSTGATGATLKEGANINKSLSALGNVINALVEAGKGKNTFIPYRNSKLTRVLQESLGGNSITSMLAAMSPAACNFEETLSTLKYANRAKAIKVKAIKNEESSQVSRLHDEIRMLKEKLAAAALSNQNNHNNIIGNDIHTNESIDMKNLQALQELEDAAKKTWESKSALSAEYEQERRRMITEQQATEQQLQSAREQSWALLEEKAEVEMTLSHLKSIANKPETSSTSDMVEEWLHELNKIISLEKATSEQGTILQVFRTSLNKDCQQLSKSFAKNRSMEASHAQTILAPLLDKLSEISTESQTWVNHQHEVYVSLSELTSKIASHLSSLQETTKPTTTSNTDQFEIIRGLDLVLRQLNARQAAYTKSAVAAQLTNGSFEDLTPSLTEISNFLKNSAVTLGESNHELAEVITRSLDQAIQSMHSHAAEVAALKSRLHSLAAAKSSELATTVVSTVDLPEESSSLNFFLAQRSPYTKGNVKFPTGSSLVRKDDVEGLPQVILQLPRGSHLREVDFCVASFEANLQSSGSGTDGMVKAMSTAVIPTVPSGDIPLPPMNCVRMEKSGLGLSDCDGEVPHTVTFVGELLDWVVLLKKNPPEKFLGRPPVRLIFDLVTHLGKTFSGALPANLTFAEWASVSETRESKTQFMDDLINYVTSQIGGEPVTSGTSIIAGADAHLTNRLLQQLALCIRRYAMHKSSSGPTLLTSSSVAVLAPRLVPVHASLTRVKLSTSSDGHNWTPFGADEGFDCSLASVSDRFTFAVPNYVAANFVRIEPQAVTVVRVDGGPSDEVSSQVGFGVDLRGVTSAVTSAVTVMATTAANGALASVGEMEALLSSVRRSLSAIVKTAGRMTEFEMAERQARAEAQRKSLEQFAAEKASLATSYEDLAEQLRKCYAALASANEALAKETALAQERGDLIAAAEAENRLLQTSLLKAETTLEAQRAIAAEHASQLAQRDATAEALRLELQYASRSQEAIESEREELAGQIAILTEERDAARQGEEALFEKLADVTTDLERLQESYVHIADRCNDAQDEVNDLRDQLASMEHACELQRAAYAEAVGNSLNIGKPVATTTPSVVTATPKASVPEFVAQPKVSASTKIPEKKTAKPVFALYRRCDDEEDYGDDFDD